ncbi:hypothetical protein ACFVGM_08800 [Kitasatospora purpeofusca]|uniref:hypothetical protein n=1 Tax=Kitasatospora purpeofusca TaxID=67352 RepID=UPI003683D008
MSTASDHLCTGPDCRACGEPTEIRQIRQHKVLRALHQLAQTQPDADHHRQASAVVDALRPTLLRWLHAEAALRDLRAQLAVRDSENARLRAELDAGAPATGTRGADAL